MQDCYDNDLNQSFLVIRSVSSESDRFPLEKDRDTCFPEHFYPYKFGYLQFIRKEVRAVRKLSFLAIELFVVARITIP